MEKKGDFEKDMIVINYDKQRIQIKKQSKR